MIDMTPFVAIFVVLGLVTLGLALYRRLITADEEDVVRLGPGEEREIPKQQALAQRLNVIDRWGKTLTVLTLIIGIGIGCAYLYKAWLDPSSVPNNFYRRNTP
jgi:hypothetical protein